MYNYKSENTLLLDFFTLFTLSLDPLEGGSQHTPPIPPDGFNTHSVFRIRQRPFTITFPYPLEWPLLLITSNCRPQTPHGFKLRLK